MKATTDESALLRAIIAHPDEDVPRLMYADCIEDSQPERSAYIAASVFHSQMHESRSLSSEAFESRKNLANLISMWVPKLWPIPVCPSQEVKQKYTWLGDTGEGFVLHGNAEFPGHRADYRRGFCWQLVIRHLEWFKYSNAILAIEPLISSVILTTEPNHSALSLFARWPQIAFQSGMRATT